ncbi:MAG: hypothetical protein EA379_07575 [Phycisphaerales bacterium]|nr:MAG: hypothetical protein EA379_07575 [Phycisphaerales bacterium]
MHTQNPAITVRPRPRPGALARLVRVLLAVALFFSLCGVLLSVMTLLGAASPTNAHPSIASAPVWALLRFAIISAACAGGLVWMRRQPRTA